MAAAPTAAVRPEPASAGRFSRAAGGGAPLCAHCGLAVGGGRTGSRFCCAGCEAVHELLAAGGLQAFYDLGGGRGAPVGAVPRPSSRDWLVELTAAARAGPPPHRLRLDVQGIRCSACVWVIEALWRKRRGLGSMRVNPALGQITLEIAGAHGDGPAASAAADAALAAFLDDVERLGYRVAPPRKSSSARSTSLLMRMGVTVALALNGMTFALAEYLGMSAEDGANYHLFRWAGLGVATLGVAVGGPVFFAGAWRGLRRGALHLDLPISVGILLAYGGSAYAFASGRGDGYFDTVTVFIALMLVGRYVQERAVSRNRDYLLRNDGAEHLRVRRFAGEGRARSIELTPVTDVRPGDRLWLAPGDLVPVRARLGEGGGAFSLDWINGESMPRRFDAGDVVPAGAFQCGSSPVQATAESTAAGAGLLDLLAAPTRDRSEMAVVPGLWRWLNRGYVAAVLGLAGLAAAAWAAIDPSRVVSVTVAMLVVTCPCAIGIAMPLAFELALAALRRAGVFVCNGTLLAKARAVRKVVFDKTGTLTWGDLRAELRGDPAQADLDVAFTMASGSNHPVSRAIAAALRGRAAFLPDLRAAEVPGRGLEATFRGASFRLGQPGFAAGERAGADGDRTCLLARDGVTVAWFGIAEDTREDAAAEVAALRARGAAVYLLSGDEQSNVDRVAAAAGIRADHARGGLSPAQKAAVVRAIDAGDTLMVGDGLNDVAAFDAATCAATPALDRPVLPSRADFCYVGGRVAAVRQTLEVAAALHRVLVTNLRLAAVYNVTAVALSAAGAMTPLLCAILMPASSLLLLGHTAFAMRPRSPVRAEA
jgi:Cu2+-exporting ATPase